ncbi:OsmC family protein [Kitasatospora paracochleata]|uniref:Organic hydroperoxide reductase OsmC/OhrA n=1 Tax=Kitasatospora paracochleata TaxID=58354 RepID=A0ABT1ISK0_9ACTN|nr:OsmC family protein [Kitasatospora paracochleata]MCP2308100.1 organic hydroperoxide reductase OsmC/OhrA [Kitasatospora paracochleata]
MPKPHTYAVRVTWTGNLGTGTDTYKSYERAHEITAEGVPPILGSADPTFRGDPSRWNPEQLLLAALSQCHMMSYFHQCAVNGVVVTSYVDDAVGTMVVAGGGGHFTEVVLRPRIEIAEESMRERALALHGPAQQGCFIAASVNFPVHHEPTVTVRA